MGIELLLDIITLIVRETQAQIDTNSDVIIESVVSMYDNNKSSKWKRQNSVTIKKMTALIKTMLETRRNGEELDLGSISRTLGLLLVADTDMLESDNGSVLTDIIKTITKEIDSELAIKEISRLKASIRNIHAKEKLKSVLAYKNLNLTKHEIEGGAVFKFIDDAILDLEEIRASSDKSDEAIMGEIDLSSDNLAEEASSTIVLKHIFKTGHQWFNKMLQGGIRTSEFTTIAALSHNYKTGYTLTTWLGVLLNNKPRPTEDGKKPLAIWLSFEDDLINIIESLYRIIYMTEEGSDPDLSSMSLQGMIDVVQTRLQATGFNVKILRVNPTLWTYKDLFNKVSSYHSMDFEVQILAVDYLDKLPTVGMGNGVHGTDKKDLVKRVRNHMSGLNIAFMTPWQLSPAAQALLKEGMAKKDLLKYIHDKSYYQGSSTLNTEIDLEIFTNKVTLPKNEIARDWLHIHRGKHKISSTLSNLEDISFFIPFPKLGMIPLDVTIDKEYPSVCVRNPTANQEIESPF